MYYNNKLPICPFSENCIFPRFYNYEFTLHYHPNNANVVANALNWKSRGVLASVASRDWQMLEIVGQFRLWYNCPAQGTFGSLVETSSLLSRVIES